MQKSMEYHRRSFRATLSTFESHLIVMRDDDVVAGGCSVQDNVLVAIYTGPPVNSKYLIVLRHAEWLHGLAVLGLHALDFQSGPVRKPQFILSFTLLYCERIKAAHELIYSNNRSESTNIDEEISEFPDRTYPC